MLHLRPILSTLRRHKTAAALITLEIALTCAIVCNAVFLIATRVERLRSPSGTAEGSLVYVAVRGVGRPANKMADTSADLAALRALPGVREAAVASQIPFGSQQWNTGVDLHPDQPTSTLDAAAYYGDPTLVRTLGLHLVAGRDLLPEEFADDNDDSDSARPPSMLVTQAVAQRLFPRGDAVGQVVYAFGNAPTRIVGVVERLARPQLQRGNDEDLQSIVLPLRPSYDSGYYVLRVADPARRDDVLRVAAAALDHHDGRRIVDAKGTLDDLRATYFRSDSAMVLLLAGVCLALLVVTAFGIVGLASFWVQQRTRMIGTRRALGATRGQILRYFQVENLLLTTAGIALGMLGAYAVNQWLMTQYELPRLPAAYLPAGALLLWALGQVAVLAPARRAANVPPAWAMRGLA